MTKKQKIFWIVLFSVLGAITLGSLIALRFFTAAKYVACSMVIALGIALTIFQIFKLKEFKKLLEEDMPLYLAELLNAGIITQEQCVNPGKKEKEMFLSEHISAIRKRRLFICLTVFFAIYGAVMFFFI